MPQFVVRYPEGAPEAFSYLRNGTIKTTGIEVSIRGDNLLRPIDIVPITSKGKIASGSIAIPVESVTDLCLGLARHVLSRFPAEERANILTKMRGLIETPAPPYPVGTPLLFPKTESELSGLAFVVARPSPETENTYHVRVLSSGKIYGLTAENIAEYHGEALPLGSAEIPDEATLVYVEVVRSMLQGGLEGQVHDFGKRTTTIPVEALRYLLQPKTDPIQQNIFWALQLGEPGIRTRVDEAKDGARLRLSFVTLDAMAEAAGLTSRMLPARTKKPTKPLKPSTAL